MVADGKRQLPYEDIMLPQVGPYGLRIWKQRFTCGKRQDYSVLAMTANG